jgi:hypothetical protein
MIIHAVFCPCWSALGSLTTTQQKAHHSAYKSVHFDHEIMEIRLFVLKCD